jgi:hypothetical protein
MWPRGTTTAMTDDIAGSQPGDLTAP